MAKKKKVEKKDKKGFAEKRDLEKLIKDFDNKQANIELHKGKGMYSSMNDNEKSFKIQAKVIENQNNNYILMYRGTVKLYLPYNLSNLNDAEDNIGKKITVVITSVEKARTGDGYPLVSCLFE